MLFGSFSEFRKAFAHENSKACFGIQEWMAEFKPGHSPGSNPKENRSISLYFPKKTLNIRRATASDRDQVWEIFSLVIQSGDTYVFDPSTHKRELKKHWFADYMQTYVLEDKGQILGTYILKPNQIGLGSHIGNCSYMVHPKAQGQGMGKMLCDHSLQRAVEMGFVGIQFNIVVSTNETAVALWKKFGFKIIGTTPKGFRHKDLGLVDTHIMYKSLV